MRSKITAQEQDLINKRSSIAKKILYDDEYEFIKEQFINQLDYIESTILNNMVKDVKEEHSISDKFKKIFFTPKEEQLNELKGQYKFIKQFISMLESCIDAQDELSSLISQKKITVLGENNE